jgi:hypothetical protein
MRRTALGHTVRRRASNLAGAADGRDRRPGHFLTTPYQWGSFSLRPVPLREAQLPSSSDPGRVPTP